MKAAGIRIWGEVELAYENAKGDVLAITGTNGKTTTTSLLGEIMEMLERERLCRWKHWKSLYAGSSEDDRRECDRCGDQQFSAGDDRSVPSKGRSAILNITPDHLNRHHTMEEYIRVKELITKNQTSEDTCVLNYEDPILRAFWRKSSDQGIIFQQ